MEIHNSAELPCESHYFYYGIIANSIEFPFITLEKKDFLINYSRRSPSYVLHLQ